MDNFANARLLFLIKFLLTAGEGDIPSLVSGLTRIRRKCLRQRNCVGHHLLPAPPAGGALINAYMLPRCCLMQLSNGKCSGQAYPFPPGSFVRPSSCCAGASRGLFVARILVEVLVNSPGKFGAECCKETSPYPHVFCVPLSFSRIPNL